MATLQHFFQPIFEISGFSVDFLISKMAKIRLFKGPPFDFSPKISDSEPEAESEWALQRYLLQGADFRGSPRLIFPRNLKQRLPDAEPKTFASSAGRRAHRPRPISSSAGRACFLKNLWQHGNMTTWQHGNMATWQHDNMTTCTCKMYMRCTFTRCN